MNAPDAPHLNVSVDAETALAQFRKLIESWRTGKDYKLASPHHPIGEAAHWRQLVNGGWHRIGVGLGTDGPASRPTNLRDLIAFCEVLGSNQVALPLVSTVLAHRWMQTDDRCKPEGAAGEGPFAIAIPVSQDTAILPFGQAAPALMRDARSGRWSLGKVDDGQIAQRDDFAATLPMLNVRRSLSLDPQQLREAVLSYLATALGCADRCLWKTVEYAGFRKAYGQLIGSFQAVKHILAEMYRDTELARSGIVGAACEEDWLPLATHCLELTRRVTSNCIQIHGGIGFTWDAGLHFHSRHVLAVARIVAAVDAEHEARSS